MILSPKQFLKARRPGQFSDSEIISESQIDSTVLEFYLDTLSTRSQEIEFERFCIRLCKTVITPNILPNTGPTGGGDAKVDSETYPVSDITALGWYSIVDTKSANERWGFAFSIQKDWGTKVRDDIKKLYETNRGYKVAYFVSSRSIKSKDKGRVQDELRNKYKIDIRILDRNWIIKEIFENKHQEIAKEELHLESITETKIKKGPLDFQKEADLEVLDKEIEKAISDNRKNPSIVDDAIRSAILARELEKPRVEIDGRFDRAERLANEFGTSYQQFEVAYQFAWTIFWWHEDFSGYVKLYQPVEDRVINTENIYNFERLTNIWYGLNNLRNQDEEGKKFVEDNFFKQHTDTLKNKLKEISEKQEEKPNAALYARTLLLEIQLAEKRFSGEGLDEVLLDLKKVVEESKNLVGFPFKPLVQILTEAGSFLEKSKEYDPLFKTILEVTEERDGEISAAKLTLNRAEKLISLGKAYEAIRDLGSSLTKLYRHESKDDAVRALYLISVGYEDVGLLWAARGALLSAASLATSDFWNYGDINTMQAACYRRLKWIELKLGRIPQVLDWHYLDFAIRNILVSKGLDQKRIFEQVDKFDLGLGVIFLRSDLTTLKKFEYLPDTLDELNLFFSSVALIYALGQTTKVPKEFLSAVPVEEMDDFFIKWANLYSPDLLPATLVNTEDLNVQLISRVLGCKIIVKTENQTPCLEVAESLLSAIESFLSTGTMHHAASREPVFEIIIDASAKNELIEFTVDNGIENPIIYIHCNKFNPHSIARTNQEKLRDILFDILVQTIARFVIFKDEKKDLEEIIKNEKASERALNFTSSFITLGNVLGHNPKTKISDWTDKKQQYPLSRTEALNFPKPEEKQKDDDKNFPEDAFSHAKHTEMQTISIIRDVLWQEAKWVGAGYMAMPSNEMPPIFAIIFNNIDAGKKIFEGWKRNFGEQDIDEEIRITIVKGIDKKNPLHYKVGIGSSMKAFEKERAKNPSRFFAASTRMHTMTPASLQNLENFKKSYDHFGYYLFAPASIGADGLPDILIKFGIVKKEIYFKEAWEIGSDDIDAAMIHPVDDDPIIPPEIENPPILDLFKSREEHRPRKLK